MIHQYRQPMPPSSARITVLEAENEALRRRVAELERQVAALTPKSPTPNAS